MKNAKLLNSYTLRMTKKIAFAAIYGFGKFTPWKVKSTPGVNLPQVMSDCSNYFNLFMHFRNSSTGWECWSSTFSYVYVAFLRKFCSEVPFDKIEANKKKLITFFKT